MNGALLGFSKENPLYLKCLLHAGRYESAEEWAKSKDSDLYRTARENRWLNKIAGKLGWPTTTEWNYSTCLRVAQEFKTLQSWGNSTGFALQAFNYAKNQRWLKKIQSDLDSRGDRWTYEACIRYAQQFGSALEWRRSTGDPRKAYLKASQNDWLKSIKQDLDWGRQWTYEECLGYAKSHDSFKGWWSSTGESRQAYRAASKRGWVTEIRKEVGWRNPRKWDYKKCLTYAKQFQTSAEWNQSTGEAKRAYQTACSNKWLEIIKKEIGWDIEYTLEDCLEQAGNYKNINEWKTGHKDTFYTALTKKWLKPIQSELGWQTRRWTYEACLEQAKAFKSSSEWCQSKGEPRKAYQKACAKKWLPKIKAELDWSEFAWNYELCKERAALYNSLVEWAHSKDQSSYMFARRNGWQRQIGTELGWTFRNNGIKTERTYQDCLSSAENYSYVEEWHRGSPAECEYARRRGWHIQIAEELGWEIQERKSWDYEKVLASATLYDSYADWLKNDRKAYRAAGYKRLNCLDKIKAIRGWD